MFGWSGGGKVRAARAALPWIFSIFAFGQLTALGADEHVHGMSPIFGHQVPWKEVDVRAASLAALSFDPEKVFHTGIW